MTAIFMDAPRPAEALANFLEVDRLLLETGLAAPCILAADAAQGFLILEDFGDQSFAGLLEEGREAGPLFDLAIEVLITLHQRFSPARAGEAGLPEFGVERFLAELELFGEIYAPAVLGHRLSAAAMQRFREAWRAALRPVDLVPKSLMLRDYHVGNLMWLEDRSGVEACGLLDFQDAGLGPISYDLVSLVEDARRDLAPELVAHSLARYLVSFPALDPVTFRTSATVLAAVRHTRVIAVFSRLAIEAGKTEYLVHIPKVWRMLERHLGLPALEPVTQWMADWMPAEARVAPQA